MIIIASQYMLSDNHMNASLLVPNRHSNSKFEQSTEIHPIDSACFHVTALILTEHD